MAPGGVGSDHRLRPQERLSRNRDFERVLREGARKQTPHFVIVMAPNDLPIRRLGLRVGRRVGRSVRRNRVKRLLREFFRLNKDLFPPSHDVVLVAKPEAAELKGYWEVAEELERALRGEATSP